MPPYRESYIAGLKWIQSELGATAIVTGDIDLAGENGEYHKMVLDPR